MVPISTRFPAVRDASFLPYIDAGDLDTTPIEVTATEAPEPAGDHLDSQLDG